MEKKIRQQHRKALKQSARVILIPWVRRHSEPPSQTYIFCGHTTNTVNSRRKKNSKFPYTDYLTEPNENGGLYGRQFTVYNRTRQEKNRNIIRQEYKGKQAFMAEQWPTIHNFPILAIQKRDFYLQLFEPGGWQKPEDVALLKPDRN